MSTKKAFVELVEFLEQNKDKKISTILDDIYDLTSSKQSSKNFLTDESGKVTHIFCYYHKLWEPVDKCSYGSKKHSPSGYNSMCKEGVNQWSKQQRESKKSEADLLDKVANGELDPDKIYDEKARIESDRKKIVPREDGIGSETIDQ